MKKRIFAALLALCLLLSLCACGSKTGDGQCASPARSGELSAVSDADYFADFEPVLRFAVASDVHVADVDSREEDQRLKELFEVAYAYADSYNGYAGLDGVFFAGDVTDRGTTYSLQKFFAIVRNCVREDTVVRATMGNHEFYDSADLIEYRFLKASGYETIDTHLELGGYHFIFISPDGKGKSYSKEKQEFLADALEEAAKADPTGCKPIFVFQHQPNSDTVYGSTTTWGVEELAPIIEKYPQVVDFAGHSHFPLNDPRSIWQGKYTALNTGTLSYYETDLAGAKGDLVFPTDQEGGWAENPTDIRDAGQFYIVELDANHAMRVLGYDLLSDGWMIEPLTIRCVDETSCFTYTNARADVSEAPAFASDATATLEVMENGQTQFRFPQASGKDPVQNYICRLYQGSDKLGTNYRLSCICFLPTPETLTVPFATTLKQGVEYRLEVTPVNVWGVQGEPLVYEFTA